jgi:hypothetical protein
MMCRRYSIPLRKASGFARFRPAARAALTFRWSRQRDKDRPHSTVTTSFPEIKNLGSFVSQPILSASPLSGKDPCWRESRAPAPRLGALGPMESPMQRSESRAAKAASMHSLCLYDGFR